jgi:hypothetical protein
MGGDLQSVAAPTALTSFSLTPKGVASVTQWALAMWDVQSFAWSDAMRFGDDGLLLKVFAMYACDTMRASDGISGIGITRRFAAGSRSCWARMIWSTMAIGRRDGVCKPHAKSALAKT